MDISYLLFLQSIREATGFAADAFFNAVSSLGSTYPAIIIIALVYWSVDKRTGIYLMFTDLWSSLVGQTMKIIFCVPRPWIRDPRISPVEGAVPEATGYSFPSGHSTNAVSVFGGLFVRIRALLRGKTASEETVSGQDVSAKERSGAKTPSGPVSVILRVIMIVSLILAILICFSRNYCEVHTLSDVLVGAGIGVIFLIVSGPLMRIYYEKKNADLIISGITILLAVLSMVFASLKAYPELLSASGGLLVDPAEMRMDTYRFAAIIIGAFAGFVIENRFARFGTHSVKISRRVLRTVIGLIIAVIILLPVSSALYAVIGEDAGRIAKYIILAVVLVGIYPCCFAAVERKLDKKQTGI